MSEVLPWSEIEKKYKNQWVQLIDFNWPDDSINPSYGRVHVHAHDRQEFDLLIKQAESPEDAARVFVGRKTNPNVYFSANLHRIIRVEKDQF